MKIENFNSGQYKPQYQYKSFMPVLVNQSWNWDSPQINTLLEQASKALAELNAFSLIVPDIDLFIRMHIVKEANQSSRIEGTQIHMDEVLVKKESIVPEKRDDWQEVQNYIQALNEALDELEQLPLSMRLLKQTHATLMSGVRGEHKSPGEFRTSQNWIGGTNLQTAVFIPPHQSDLAELLSDLEKFWHNEEIFVPHLIRIAISHYQFETIHPFLDGNGRIGRLLITLYMFSNGLLHKPSLYLSDFLEQHRGDYYDALTTVRKSHDLEHWIKFFLTAVLETATKGKETFQNILQLRQDCEAQIITLGRRAENARKLLLQLYQQPIMSIKQVSALLELTPRAATALVNEFVKMGILVEKTGYKRNKEFVFEQYLKLF
ncbi:MAG: Fic family protein [gamma proteobacterium symbiont of Taylorina sp.]|nr:Fic family protein [gamma proteobacterium symbiont of Taylorina sp.]